METIEINAPSIQQHNAQFSREAEIVREIDRILRLHLFPSDRIWIDVRFDYGMADHSSSKAELLSINGEIHGTVEIKLQGIYLWQDFQVFISEVIPHELAHVLIEVDCAMRGTKVEKPHDEAWCEKLSQIDPEVEPASKVKGEFDERPVRAGKGGVVCACECGGVDAVSVFPNTPATAVKLRNQELECTQCNSAYARLKPEEWPDEIRSAFKFYEGVVEVKIHNSPLTR